MTYHIEPDDFSRALESAVAAKGKGHIYKGTCVYVKPIRGDTSRISYTPDCLIGHALVECGVPTDILGDNEINFVVADTVLSRMTDLPKNIIVAAREAQKWQDEGRSWGIALKKYQETLKELS